MFSGKSDLNMNMIFLSDYDSHTNQYDPSSSILLLYNLSDVDFVVSHEILSICPQFFGRGISLLSFSVYKLLTESSVKENNIILHYSF